MSKFLIIHTTRQGLSVVEKKPIEAPDGESAAHFVGGLYTPEDGVAFQDANGIGYYIPTDNLSHLEAVPEDKLVLVEESEKESVE